MGFGGGAFRLVKSQVLKALRKEPFHLARRAICGVVSKIGSIELKAQQWPEVLNAINAVVIFPADDA